MKSSLENKSGFSSVSFVADRQSVIVCRQLCSESQSHAGGVVVVGSSPPLLWGRLSAEQQRQIFVLFNLRMPQRAFGLQSSRHQMFLMSAAGERLQFIDVTEILQQVHTVKISVIYIHCQFILIHLRSASHHKTSEQQMCTYEIYNHRGSSRTELLTAE